MRHSQTRKLRRLVILGVAIGACTLLPLLSKAHSSSSTNIINNSNRQIIHVYLSRVDDDNWTGDQLNETTIAPGQSFNLSNFACDQPQIKILAEDQDGCFLATIVSCGISSTWTINNDTAADCGQ